MPPVCHTPARSFLADTDIALAGGRRRPTSSRRRGAAARVRTTGTRHAELRTLIADRLQQAAHRMPGAGMAIEWLDDAATETSPDARSSSPSATRTN